MEDRETPRMHKCGESKTTRIMMETVRHVTSGSGLRKIQAAWILLDRVYSKFRKCFLPFNAQDTGRHQYLKMIILVI